eukprot:TRINITY_DN6885_c0_g1_i1.p1 TRINITY_DN6885_c0_g1~~TRINITY_DN6885_c0_g1_i1.p1  ORF type:complete len:969 (+),score=237.71 TRINITY_DN6885_c0_g1_i1:199-2907(+)
MAVATALPIVLNMFQSTTGGTVVPERQTWQGYRLPPWVSPVAYTLMIKPDFNTFTFIGNVTIDVTVMSATKLIVIHAAELSISTVSVWSTVGSVAVTYSVARTWFSETYEYLYIELENTLPVGAARLQFGYVGSMNDQLRGFYRSSYTANGVTKYIGVTQFEPTDARRAFPCFDEPALKAHFTISIEAESTRTVLSNMQLSPTGTVPNPHRPGFSTWNFATSVQMSTYLVAWVVCDFEHVETQVASGPLIRVWTRPGETSTGVFALNVAQTVLTFYETYLRTRYPLSKLDLIAIPDFAAGAMENWGLITFRDNALLVDPTTSSQKDIQRVAVVVAHELAHQWFGNLVTIDWWSDLWLNEGFATFFEYLGTDAAFPQWQMFDQFVVEDLVHAMTTDALVSTHPLVAPDSTTPAQINQLFDDIEYSKGGSVLRMLSTYLDTVVGPGTFRAGLVSYLTSHAYGNVGPADLWASMRQVSGLDVAALMQQWASAPGYPVLTVTDSATTSVQLSQSRFFSAPDAVDPVSPPTVWWVPVTYLTSSSGGVVSATVLNGASGLLTPVINAAAGEWIKVNINATGLYRVLYTPAMWGLLKPLVAAKALDLRGRAMLIDDAFSLGLAERMDIRQALDLATSLQTETEFVVWNTAIRELNLLNQLLNQKPAYGDYKAYVRSVISQIVPAQSWTPTPGEPHLAEMLRELVLLTAVQYEDQTAAQDAMNRFVLFNTNETANPLAASVRAPAYTATVMYGAYDGYQMVLDRYLAATQPTEKRRLLDALATTPYPDLITTTLELCLSANVRSQDTVRCISQVTYNPVGRHIAWLFFRNNLDVLLARYGDGGFALQTLIINIAGKFASNGMYEDIDTYFGQHPLPAASLAVQQALETITAQAGWLQRNYANVATWLSQY